MAKRKNTTAAPSKGLTPNTDIIRLAIDYACCVQSVTTAYRVDPSGDNTAAVTVHNRVMRRANTSLTTLADMPATTAEELSAKARVVEYMLANGPGAGFAIDDIELRYMARFADDVRAFVTPTIDAAWKAAHKPAVTA